jgi:AcrR family transcriptional regulator
MLRKARKARTADVVIDAALALAAERSWRGVTLADIAAHAGVPLASLLERYPSKLAILLAFARRVDQAVLAGIDPALNERAAQERLFDVVMRRLDALAPHKAALASIARGGTGDLTALCAGACSLSRSLDLMLEAAGLSAEGVCGALRRKGLAFVYLDTLRVFLADDSADLDRTMKTLDGHLRRIAKCVATLRGACGRLRGTRAEAPQGAAPS